MTLSVLSRSPVADLYWQTSKVIGQEKARRQLAVLIARQLEVAQGLKPKSQSAVVGGWTGVGKTYLTRMMCEACGLPFAEVNATQFTETGYAGDDLSQMFVPLLESAARILDRRQEQEPEQVASVLKREDLKAVVEVASSGVLFLDEMDKWMHRINHHTGRLDTAIQAELLKMVEGSVEYVSDEEDEIGIPFDTSRVLIICAGAFVGLAQAVLRRLDRDQDFLHDEGFWELIEQRDFVRYGFIPELAGRLGIYIFLKPLRKEQLAEILKQPGSSFQEYRTRFQDFGVEWGVKDPAVSWIADQAIQKEVGARGIETVLWRIFADALFQAAISEHPTRVEYNVSDHKARVVAA
jgi:ATP-dependent Clp protease ATP-binding subunit ClpX